MGKGTKEKMRIYWQDGTVSIRGDRALGNKLFNWETIYYMNSLNDFAFEIKVPESDYLWVKNGLVNLPNTSTYRQSEIPSDAFYLNPNMTVKELVPYYWDGKKFPLRDNVIKMAGVMMSYHFKPIPEAPCSPTNPVRENETEFFKDIKVNKELDKKTAEVAKDISLSIHLRRGGGMRYTQKYIDEVMSEKSKDYFLSWKDVKLDILKQPQTQKDWNIAQDAKQVIMDSVDSGTPLEHYQVKYDDKLYILEDDCDDMFFDILDNITAIDPDAKICLIHDTFDEDYNHWFERYPKNLVTTRQLLNKEDFSDPVLKNEEDDILRAFIDLLILLKTKVTFLNDQSSFSHVVNYWKRVIDPFLGGPGPNFYNTGATSDYKQIGGGSLTNWWARIKKEKHETQ